jgi:hypothetical protein
VAPGFTATLRFQGTFAADNQVTLFNITANTAEIITIQTDRYADGTLDSTPVSAGGFAPTAYLFDNSGDVLTLTDGTCFQVGLDATTGNCDDLSYQNLLQPGTFTLSLAVLDNSPVGLFVTDGFVQTATPASLARKPGPAAVSAITLLPWARPGQAITASFALCRRRVDRGAAVPLQFTTSLTRDKYQP